MIVYLSVDVVVLCIMLDFYQITMAYAYWKSNKCWDMAVFDLFFRKNPFNGEFTIFAGLEECLKFLRNFRYSPAGMYTWCFMLELVLAISTVYF